VYSFPLPTIAEEIKRGCILIAWGFSPRIPRPKVVIVQI